MAPSSLPGECSAPPPAQSLDRISLVFCVILLLCPIVFFYALLSSTLTGLPFNDDYNAVLMFLLRWHAASGWHKAALIWNHQHNEYRLAFQNTIYALQYGALGQVVMKPLTVLGDLLVLPLFGMLWLLWRAYNLPLRYALPAFVPVAWILFQLQYASTLNCVMAPLQNVAVLVFTLAVFYFGTRPRWEAFAGAIVSLALAVASSGGGLFVGPVLCLFYLQKRSWARLSLTIVASVALGFFYMHGKPIHEHDPNQGDLASFLHQISLPYGAAFLGSIATTNNPLPAIAFAAILFGVFVWETRDRLYRLNPGLYYTTLFFFAQGLAVSCLRAPRGLVSALGSRYRINSAVLAILIYFYLAERARSWQLTSTFRTTALTLAGLLLVAFTFASDKAGNTLLAERRAKVQAGIRAWESDPAPFFIEAAKSADIAEEERKREMYDPVEPTLSKAIEEGIYKVPAPGPGQ